MQNPTLFTVRTEDGVESSFYATRGEYDLAAVDSVIHWDIPLPCRLTVWAPSLLPKYGPYEYLIHRGRGHLAVECVACHSDVCE